jgi:uncharacterized protein YegP (UPF0339 family)
MKIYTINLYRDISIHEDWRWRVTSRNGRIVADSGEGYRSKKKCLTMAAALFRSIPAVMEFRFKVDGVSL